MRPQSDPGLAASVMARLKNFANQAGEEFNPTLERWVAHRFLYRLSVSTHKDHFCLKGATMFLLWTGVMHRPTRDIDLLAVSSSDEDELARVCSEICAVDCTEDGVIFDPETIKVERIREEQAYGGLRITLLGYVGNARVKVQVDVGFGDAVTPDASEVELPQMITGVPLVRMLGYPAETSVAEKLHAMVALGQANSRMKDFYDVKYIADTMEIEGKTLALAIERTFARRKTDLPTGIPLALTSEFWENAATSARWSAFTRKSGLHHLELADVCGEIAAFLMPVLTALAAKQAFDMKWKSPGWHDMPTR
ncbi:MAG: nucleotidyl transferase AbiEii/AbiGii toxin family protein [Fimbriimonadaceae bacterium]